MSLVLHVRTTGLPVAGPLRLMAASAANVPSVVAKLGKVGLVQEATAGMRADPRAAQMASVADQPRAMLNVHQTGAIAAAVIQVDVMAIAGTIEAGTIEVEMTEIRPELAATTDQHALRHARITQPNLQQ